MKFGSILFVPSLLLASISNAASFIGLGGYGVDQNSDILSVAFSVSGNGQIATGYSSLPSGGSAAVYWDSAGQMHDLGYLTGGSGTSIAYGASGNGSVIAGRSNSINAGSGLPEAFKWTPSGGMIGLGDLGGGASQANSVSSTGASIVGWSWNNSQTQTSEAFLWTESAGMTGLGDLNGGRFLSEATDVSANGTVVGFSESTNGIEAFRWTRDAGMQGIGALSGSTTFGSRAEAISADGSTIVGASRFSQNNTNTELAFLHTLTEGMISLGTLGGGVLGSSHAFDVSADGRVVVGISSPGKAFIWTAGQGMRDLEDVLTNDYGLDLTGWDLENAYSISDDGLEIVGVGTIRSGIWKHLLSILHQFLFLRLGGYSFQAFLG